MHKRGEGGGARGQLAGERCPSFKALLLKAGDYENELLPVVRHEGGELSKQLLAMPDCVGR